VGLRETSANLDRYFTQEERVGEADFIADEDLTKTLVVKPFEEPMQSISSS